MPIATSNKTSDIPLIPSGSQLGICYACIDIGTQPQSNPKFKPHRKIMLLFELPHVRADFEMDGQTKNLARVISQRYTLSLSSKANLRHDLIAWRGRDFTPEEEKAFEVNKVVGAMALLSITHKKSADGTRTFANITGIMKPMAGTDKMKPENPTLVYDLPQSGPITFPQNMPEWIQNVIKGSEEYVRSVNPHAAPAKSQPTDDEMANLGEGDSSVPF